MRILLLCGDRGIPALGPSGSSAHLRGVAAALVERGHEVRVATPRRVDDRGEHGVLAAPSFHAEPRSWRWLPRPWRERGETWDARRLARVALADGWRPDLVWERYALFVDAGARLGVPRLLEVNAPLSLERPRVDDRGFARRAEVSALRSATRVIAVSAWLRGWAIAQGCAPDRVVHVPNGTSAPAGDRDRGRARHGLAGLVVGFVGSMKAWHGLDRLPALLDALPEATALLVGDGPVRISHPRLVRVGVLDGIALADAVSAMDVGLVPYPPEAPPWFCPLKVLDYRAQGVPVVGADVGDTRALVGDDGVVLPAGADLATWARAIRSAAALPRRSMPRPWTRVVDEALAGIRPSDRVGARRWPAGWAAIHGKG